jgi:two-component system, OmpR family, sensor histidine kinase KdpD
MSDSPRRPDPQAVLARVQRAEGREQRGRFKIWFGAAPGVGKTYAMLASARRRLAQGQDTVVGCVETHGRAETEALLRGLEVLPARRVDYQGHALFEFDLEAALRRRPALLLVDELAHSNVPGSRFAKRWEDVQALLAAGIDVESTLNVQHLESLNDVVAQVTGVAVRETVPDHVLATADEVVLVDLPPEALLERLRAGKVYRPEVATAALEGFFRHGNLAALRELALRRTAQWVDTQLQTWRHDHGITRAWGTGERILVAVGPSPLSARLVRAAHRTSRGLRADLFAVYVETPGMARSLTGAQRERLAENLRLAESLGAANALIAFAREHDIARIVLGKSGRARWRERLFGSLPMDVIRHSGDIDVHVVRTREGDPEPAEAVAFDADRTSSPATVWWSPGDALRAIVIVAVSLSIAMATFRPGDLSTEAMVLILGIVVVSLCCRRWVAFFAVVVNAAAFNFLFTEPRFSFSIADPTYVVAFLVMMAIGFTVTSLVARARERAEFAQQRERESAILSSLVRELAGADTDTEVAKVTLDHLRDCVPGDMAVLMPMHGAFADVGCVLGSHGVPDWLGEAEFAVARWSFDHGQIAGAGTGNLPGSTGLFLPLVGFHGRVGVVAFRAEAARIMLQPKMRMLMSTLVEQSALALERLQARREKLETERAMEVERLRSTLLASVSHDLRTPLATITGSASTLLDGDAELDEVTRHDLLAGIATEAHRLNELIGNLVFATRFEAGKVTLRREWTSLEEVVGAALHRSREVLERHQVEVEVAADLPLLQADPVLLEQAVFLLLDNAARHTPAGTAVVVRASASEKDLSIEVADAGPGIPIEQRARLFQRFERGRDSDGMGLGLAIAAAILRAHGGSAMLVDSDGRGAVFQLRLPRPTEQPGAPEAAASEEDRHA